MICNRNNGNGCPYLMIYKGEKYVHQYLKSNNISFIQQQKFSDLIGTGGWLFILRFFNTVKKIWVNINRIQRHPALRII